MARPTKNRLIKEKQGTLQKCRDNADEVEFKQILKIPAAPKWFTKLGKKIYRVTSTELANYGVLNAMNLPLLIAYSNSIAIYLETEETLNKGVSRLQTLKNPDGSISKIIANPLIKISRDALEDARKLATEFGLTPAAQSKIIRNINSDEDPDEEDFS